jgi:peptide/nickel transport system substrate-binding protein
LNNKIMKRVAAAILALLLVVALAACGGSESSSGGGSAGASAGGSAAAGGGSGGEEGGGSVGTTGPLVIGVSGSLASLDINQLGGILDYKIAAVSLEGLVGIDNSGQIIPTLAESWTDEDATVWTFKLRPDVTFWDGTPLTADDVIYSIQRSMDPEQSPGVVYYFPDYVTGVEKAADDEVKITLDGPHANFILAVSNTGGLFVQSKAFLESAESVGSAKDLLMGTGPFVPAEFEAGSHVTYVANENWWGGRPSVNSLRFDFFADENTRLLAFTQGDIDFAFDVPVDQAEQWEGVDGATVSFLDNRAYYGLTFDVTVAPFDDEHVRKAVAYAIDKDSIVAGGVLKGHGTPATAIQAPEQFAAAMSVDEAAAKLADVTHYDFDIDKAKEELAQSGSPDGFEVELSYPDAYQAVGKASLIIASSLEQIGITLNVKEIPLDQWLGEVGNGEQGVAWMIYEPTTPEPGEIAGWLLDAEGPGYNPANWTDEEVTTLRNEMMAAPDFASEIEPTLKANSIAQEQAIYAPVWWGQSAIAAQQYTHVKDFNSYSLLSSNWPELFAA